MFVKINDPADYENTNIEGYYQCNNQYKKVSSTYVIKLIRLQKFNKILIISGSCGVDISIKRERHECFYIGCFDIINDRLFYKYKMASDQMKQLMSHRYDESIHKLEINDIDLFINHIDPIIDLKISDILDFIKLLPDTFSDTSDTIAELLTNESKFVGIFQKLTLKPINIHLPTVII